MVNGGNGLPKSDGGDKPTQDLSETAAFGASTNIGPSGDADFSLAGGTFSPAERAEDEADLPVAIPGFTIEQELGRGAFGVVYAARDQLLDRRVAIKLPLIDDPHYRQQYIDEARKAVKLDHPAIVPIYQVGMTAQQQPFVVQKLIEGSTLRKMLLASGSRLPLGQTIALLRQVCHAVDAAHAAGVVHRDLKPENLLIDADGRVYVADFGLAIVDDEEDRRKKKEVAGTPLYMSPEQFAGRTEWLDGRTDIWAIGVMLYELLSGKPPFSGQTLAELREQVRHKDPRPLHQRDPSIPQSFDSLFRKCCAKNVADRFGSIRELLNALESIGSSLPLEETVAWSHGSKPTTVDSFGARTHANGKGGDSLHSLPPRTPGGEGLSTLRGSRRSLPTSDSRFFWSFLAPVLTTVATLALVISLGWYWRRGPLANRPSYSPTPPPHSPLEPPLGENALAGELSKDPRWGPRLPRPGMDKKFGPLARPGLFAPLPEEGDQPVPRVPAKPFRVSIAGDGTHASLAAAIADSAAGETITVLEGTYREGLVIDRSLTLRGEGTVKLVSPEQSCIEVRADSHLTLEKIELDGQAPHQNTIEIVSGRVNLSDCKVYASSPRSYDCVKVRSQGILAAERCEFQSMEHAAVSGEAGATIAIQHSSFRFLGGSDLGQRRSGVQANGSRGLLRHCQFLGPCLAGIDWMDSPEQTLTIENCRFDHCYTGIQLRNCGSVRLLGTPEEPLEILHATFGLNLIHSKAHVSGLVAAGVGEKSKVGFQITEDSEVDSTELQLSNFLCGTLVKDSRLQFEQLAIADPGFAGVLVDDAVVEGASLTLEGVAALGVAVLSAKPSVKIETIRVTAARQDAQKLASAIYTTSGEVFFGELLAYDCLCGLFFDPDKRVIEDLGLPQRRILAELLPVTRKTKMPLPRVVGQRIEVNGCEFAALFLGTGSTQVPRLDSDLPADRRVPHLLQPEKLEIEGDWQSGFAVTAR
jgi:serine/threonine protein kinase